MKWRFRDSTFSGEAYLHTPLGASCLWHSILAPSHHRPWAPASLHSFLTTLFLSGLYTPAMSGPKLRRWLADVFFHQGTYWLDPNEGATEDAVQAYCNSEKKLTCISPIVKKVKRFAISGFFGYFLFVYVYMFGKPLLLYILCFLDGVEAVV